MGGLKSASVPPWICSYLRRLPADLWRIRRVYYSRGLERTCCGLHRSPPQTQKSAADSLRIRHMYAAELWTYFSKNKF